jgi:hypothetical protein
MGLVIRNGNLNDRFYIFRDIALLLLLKARNSVPGRAQYKYLLPMYIDMVHV